MAVLFPFLFFSSETFQRSCFEIPKLQDFHKLAHAIKLQFQKIKKVTEEKRNKQSQNEIKIESRDSKRSSYWIKVNVAVDIVVNTLGESEILRASEAVNCNVAVAVSSHYLPPLRNLIQKTRDF